MPLLLIWSEMCLLVILFLCSKHSFLVLVLYRKCQPHLRVWYGHPFRLHCGPVRDTGRDVHLPWWWIIAPLLEWQLPAGKVGPQHLGPLGLTPALLSLAVFHTIGSRAVSVLCCHGSHEVWETACLCGRVGLQPLATGVTTHRHDGRGWSNRQRENPGTASSANQSQTSLEVRTSLEVQRRNTATSCEVIC